MKRYVEINKPGSGTATVTMDELHAFLHREIKELLPGDCLRLTVVEMEEAQFETMEDFKGWKS